jgi:hypothetical protein
VIHSSKLRRGKVGPAHIIISLLLPPSHLVPSPAPNTLVRFSTAAAFNFLSLHLSLSSNVSVLFKPLEASQLGMKLAHLSVLLCHRHACITSSYPSRQTLLVTPINPLQSDFSLISSFLVPLFYLNHVARVFPSTPSLFLNPYPSRADLSSTVANMKDSESGIVPQQKMSTFQSIKKHLLEVKVLMGAAIAVCMLAAILAISLLAAHCGMIIPFSTEAA